MLVVYATGSCPSAFHPALRSRAVPRSVVRRARHGTARPHPIDAISGGTRGMLVGLGSWMITCTCAPSVGYDELKMNGMERIHPVKSYGHAAQGHLPQTPAFHGAESALWDCLLLAQTPLDRHVLRAAHEERKRESK